MRLQHKWLVRMLGLGLAAAPMLVTTVRAADQPADGQGNQQPQEGRHGKPGPAGMLHRYHAAIMKLNLTDDQKPKINAAFHDAKQKIDAAVKDANGDHDALRTKVRPIMKELHKTVDGILTQDQKDQLAKERQQHHPHGQNAGK